MMTYDIAVDPFWFTPDNIDDYGFVLGFKDNGSDAWKQLDENRKCFHSRVISNRIIKFRDRKVFIPREKQYPFKYCDNVEPSYKYSDSYTNISTPFKRINITRVNR